MNMASGAMKPGPDFLAGGGELGALMRGFDWQGTPLGPPSSWPQSLRMAVRIMLTSLQPIWIGWGSELTYLYNDPVQVDHRRQAPVGAWSSDQGSLA